MDEIWKAVIGYEKLYQVSNIGNVKSFVCGYNFNTKEIKFRTIPKILNHNIQSGHGYLTVMLCRDGEQKRKRIHRLVAEAFIPNKNIELTHINHIDGNKKNNCYDNLEWTNNSRNQKHAYANGLQVSRKGEECKLSKLKENQVRDIRKMFNSGIKITDGGVSAG